jgi:hypothetical protein
MAFVPFAMTNHTIKWFMSKRTSLRAVLESNNLSVGSDGRVEGSIDLRNDLRSDGLVLGGEESDQLGREGIGLGLGVLEVDGDDEGGVTAEESSLDLGLLVDNVLEEL